MGLDIIGKWRRITAAWSVLCLVAACGGGAAGPVLAGRWGRWRGGLEGDYQLVGANDETLPTTVTSNICAPVMFTGGSLTLNANGTFEMAVSYTNDHGAPDGFQDHGRYHQNGAEVQFTSEAWGDQFQAEFNGSVMITHYDFCSDNQGAELELDFGI